MNDKDRGFTLLEMTVAMVVMLVVAGAVFQLLDQSQQRYVSTATAEDITSMTRDALDQMVTEIRLAGYPPPNSYPGGLISGANNNMNYAAVAGGFRAANSYAVQFEADVSNSGTVSVIDYQLQVPTGGATGGCGGLTANAALTTPTLMISRQPKNADGSAITPAFEPFLENVQNCTQSVPIFTYCPAPPATAPAGCPTTSNLTASSLAAPQNTVMVMIDLLVLATERDPKTGVFQNIELFGSAQRVNPDQ